jgi:hypothetical protein
MRARKLIGGMAMVVLVVVYSLAAMSLAVLVLPGTAWYTQLAFYLIGGFVWILPSMALIWWMTRPDGPPRA